MLLSIITVVYNCREELIKTVASVLEQSGDPIQFEYIVVDGGSNDGTIDVIRSSNNVITKWISDKDEGIYDAMNRGAQLAEGEWLYFLNAGDLFPSNNTLKDMLRYIEREKSDFVYGNYYESYGNKEILNKPPSELQIKDQVYKFLVCHQASAIRRDKFNELGGFNTAFRYCADQELLLRLHLSGAVVAKIELDFCLYDTTGLSAENRWKVFSERMKIDRIHGVSGVGSFIIYVLRLIIFSAIKKLGLLKMYRKVKLGG